MLKVGERFGAYTVIREVGRGGMAVVYEAEHAGLHKRVALKVLLAPADEAVRRFLQEGVAAARTRHEHIVETHDAGEHDGTAFLVMELLEGESLATLLRREGTLAAQRVADLLLPVASALASAHAAGIVHRDVKPENVFLARSRRGEVVPKVLDFGVAHMAPLGGDAQRLTGSAALVGTVGYMSPEQCLNAAPVGSASDQYALGVLMFECVTGRLPHLKSSAFETLSAIIKGRERRPSSINPDVDPRLEAIILRAMAREPGDRYPDLHALGAALLPLASPASAAHWGVEFGATAAPAATVAARPIADRRPRRRWALAPLAALPLLGLIAWRHPAERSVPPAVVARPAPPPEAPRAVAPAPPPSAPPLLPSVSPSPAPSAPAPRRAVAAPARRPRLQEAPSPPVAAPAPAPATPATPWLLRTDY